ncbi:hypothetical protein ILYODFUR_009704 [Ilyodon furcidens]|uniref:Uncharacterized protein n=1 Tax=Ilyodon furcidens TaxID=33524 RepID=A0ABV0UQI4_9TELE
MFAEIVKQKLHSAIMEAANFASFNILNSCFTAMGTEETERKGRHYKILRHFNCTVCLQPIYPVHQQQTAKRQQKKSKTKEDNVLHKNLCHSIHLALYNGP